MKTIKRTTIIEAIIVLFVMLFLYTGISKIMDYRIFKVQIGMSPILNPIAPVIAAALPWVEFLAVLLLIVPRWRLMGLKLSLILMTSFTLYVIAILIFNKDLPCSCGGIIELMSWSQHIIFNVIFTILAFVGILLEKGIRMNNKRMLVAILKNI
ncbi:MAG: hypothetical protein P4L51_15185 [Puia sp.]|nr:hypothetical protein [Puia sp.]